MTGTLSLVAALASATALAGAAVFTVHQAGCAQSGEYVPMGEQVELVGGCLDPRDLTPALVKNENQGGLNFSKP
jgi:hypothetical protein